jgi:hypothetical protein
MGPHGGGVAGKVAEEPGRGERAPIASWGGMRRSEKCLSLHVCDDVLPAGEGAQEGNRVDAVRDEGPASTH